ncbi:MAG: STAS domain-containing protein [Chloroflexales bacterium]|nr:STAS domain-containing protein [Chloroflexales bacterium]
MNIAVLAVVWQGQGALFDPVLFTFATTQAIAVMVTAIVSGKAQRDAEANAHRAEETLICTERQAQELAQHASDLEQQNEQQRQLLDLVSTLEIPAVSLADGVLLAPLVGHLDSRRAQMLTSQLLLAINAQRTQLVLLDIAGVSTIDTSIDRAPLETTQAVRLLGYKIIITGISASVAVTITHLGINLAGIATARTPQEALVSYVARMASQYSATINGNGALNSMN